LLDDGFLGKRVTTIGLVGPLPDDGHPRLDRGEPLYVDVGLRVAFLGLSGGGGGRRQCLNLEGPEARVRRVVGGGRAALELGQGDAVDEAGVDVELGRGGRDVAVQLDRVEALLGVVVEGRAVEAAPDDADRDGLGTDLVEGVIVFVEGGARHGVWFL